MTSKSLLAALGLSIAVAAFGPGAPPARADIIEEVAAFVNGQILTRSEIADREAQIRQQLTRQFAGDDLRRRSRKRGRTCSPT